jgi:cell division protein FtsB
MTTSTATTTRRSPVRADRGTRLAELEQRELATRGANALAPAPATRPGTGKGRSRLRVAPPVPVTVPRAPFVAMVLFVVVAGVLGILVLNTKINENAFKLAQLQSQRNDLDQQEQQLDQQLAELDSPNNLAAAACRRHMVAAGTPAYLTLPNGQVVSVPQPATAAQCVTGQQAGNAQAGSAQVQGNPGR